MLFSPFLLEKVSSSRLKMSEKIYTVVFRSRRLKKPSVCQVLLGLFFGWLIFTFTTYVLDLPGLGGSDEYCDSFYLPPDNISNSSNIYPYLNTFGIAKPINWSKSAVEEPLNKYRIVGTHNSYHIQQYPGSS